MQDWNAYRGALLERVGDLAKVCPDVVRGLTTIDNAAAKTGHLYPKVRELIACSAAVMTRCDGCIAVYTKEAVEHGASTEAISKALGAAVALNAGTAKTYSARVLEARAQLQAA